MNLLIKLSGEFITEDSLPNLSKVISSLKSQGHKIGIVVGGGNIIRGRDFPNNRREVDRIGLYSTLINGLILKLHLKDAEIVNSFKSDLISDRSFESIDDKIAIFTGGTGIPYFSTDTAAVLRALDMNADLILKATKVDGVYESDPEMGDAKKYDRISFREIVDKELGILDSSAAIIASENNLKMVVFDGRDAERILEAVKLNIGTIIER